MRRRLAAAAVTALCAAALAADTPGGDRMASSEQIHGWIQELCATGHRRPGTPQDREGAHYVARKFTEFGLEDVRIDPIPLTSWQAGAWGLGGRLTRGGRQSRERSSSWTCPIPLCPFGVCAMSRCTLTTPKIPCRRTSP